MCSCAHAVSRELRAFERLALLLYFVVLLLQNMRWHIIRPVSTPCPSCYQVFPKQVD